MRILEKSNRHKKIGKPPIFLLPKNSFISLKFVNRFIFFFGILSALIAMSVAFANGVLFCVFPHKNGSVTLPFKILRFLPKPIFYQP